MVLQIKSNANKNKKPIINIYIYILLTYSQDILLWKISSVIP